MAVIEDLEESEKYLWAILSDPSGLDQAEFLWHDQERQDGCWRAWSYQWKWFRCTDPLQIDQCARSVGKSLSIKVRAFSFPILHPGQELVITAPEGNHLDAVTDVIETAFVNSRFGKSMLVHGRTGIKHKPFHMNFGNGSRIMGRIPQRDGKGVKGIHPLWLELDEAQDYPEAGWIELMETLKRGHKGAVWRAHGVTRGVRDKHFYKFTADPNSKWKVHQFSAQWRPTWTDEERSEKIDQYGGRDDPDYRRNILGAHGDAMSPLFVLHRLMNCVDDDKESDYNQDEYQYYRINEALLREMGLDIIEHLMFPDYHRQQYQTFWCGMDVGYTNHPSEILVFAESRPNKEELGVLKRLGKAIPPEGRPRLKLVTRINLTRVGVTDQVKAILWTIDYYKPRAFSMDKTGNGLPLFQEVQELNRQAGTIVKGYNFSGKILVGFDETIPFEEWDDLDDQIKKAGIERNTVEYATDRLRALVDDKRLWLPWDQDLLGEFQGQTYKVSRSANAMNQYGKREYSQGKFHALDAARMAVLGWAQYSIEQMTQKAEVDEPVLDAFGL